MQQSEPKTTSFIKSRILHSPSESLGLVIMENGEFMDSRKYYLQRNKDSIVSYITLRYRVFQKSFGTHYIVPICDQRHLQFAVTEQFTGTNWRLHPDWVYCEYNYAGDQHEFENPEETMKHFFHKMQKPRWNWGTTRVVPLPQCSKGAYQRGCEICKHLKIFFIILGARL